MKNGTWGAYFKKHRCLALLIALSLWLVLEPLASGQPLLELAFVLTIGVILLIGPYIITGNRKLFFTCLAVVALMLTSEYLAGRVNARAFNNLAFALTLMLDALIIVWFISYATSTRITTTDRIYGAILVYIIIGFFFADVFRGLDLIEKNAFSFPSASVNDKETLFMNDYLYLSFTTLTTMGYGDAVPRSPMAKRLCNIEACVGVIYMAVFIGRLIGVYAGKDDLARDQTK